MTDHALVAVATPAGWLLGETTWYDDRRRPDDWETRSTDPRESFRAVVEQLDFARFAGVYRERDGDWTAFLACWLAIEHVLGEPPPDPRGDGALVAVDSAREAAALRAWVRAAKESVTAAVRADQLSTATARCRLLVGLRRRASDREVIIGPSPADAPDSRRFSDRPDYGGV